MNFDAKLNTLIYTSTKEKKYLLVHLLFVIRLWFNSWMIKLTLCLFLIARCRGVMSPLRSLASTSTSSNSSRKLTQSKEPFSAATCSGVKDFWNSAALMLTSTASWSLKISWRRSRWFLSATRWGGAKPEAEDTKSALAPALKNWKTWKLNLLT